MDRNVYGPEVELAQLRKEVGMVFQRPNPLPISIWENIIFGHKIHAPAGKKVSKSDQDEIVENSLRQVLLWDQVKDHLKRKATSLLLSSSRNCALLACCR